ncbi:hypothetical protein L2737_13900 [Shewanella electrodiphila]|uniref:Uncharacterized protein n=1 Tax=Shewanella electrodiphila TaxID=934143 RepID=A0ABT0KSA6_9GAMM|nr:hypothetical protein [Shewanella electrodiphila]MCL1046406.1 hypothetical protein [Shewanella electrodiphila]
MKYVNYRLKPRLLIVVGISLLVSLLLILLELTPWAEQINLQGYSHGDGEKRDIPSYMRYILPFVKELILIGVPMLLTVSVMKLYGFLKRLIKPKIIKS